MKKIIFAFLLTTSSAWAVNEDSLRSTVQCIDGFKFLIVWSISTNSSPTVTQMFKTNGPTLPPQPITCRK